MNALQCLTLWGVFTLAIVNYRRFRDVLYPPVIQAIVWFVVLAGYLMNKDKFNEVSDDLYLIVLNGVLMFSIGGYLTTYKVRIPVLQTSDAPYTLTDSAYSRLLFWFPLLCLPLFLIRAYELGHGGPTDFLLINIRHVLLTEGLEEGYGVLQYLVPISFLSSGLQLYRHLYHDNWLRLGVSFTVAITYAVLSTGRGFVLLLLIMLAGITMITRKTDPLRGWGYFTMALCGALLFAGYMLQKGLHVQNDLSENVLALQQHFTAYLVGSLPAFDHYWHADQELEYGVNTFRSVLAGLQRIGLDVEVPPLIQEMVYIPIEFNVYTIYLPYSKDYGAAGILLVQLLFGAWHGYLFKKANGGTPFHVMLYALFLFPLVMQFFQDQYFSLLSMWLQFGSLMVILFYRLRFWESRNWQCQP
jgi:oligosaccharide repeat unit polymerase